MKRSLWYLIIVILVSQSCVSKKKHEALQAELALATNDFRACVTEKEDCYKSLNELRGQMKAEVAKYDAFSKSKAEIEANLKSQLEDLKEQREQQYSQVGDLTVLTQAANENMTQTIKQLEQKDKYINRLMNAKSKADSLNLALAVNLKTVLKDGIDDEDVEIKVDKTVVFINISDKMLFESGSYKLTSRADQVLEKISKIIKSKPDLELMVEGYTDNVPIRNSCIEDNWDLSVKRSAQVVRKLQKDYNVDPNKLIAAGRGEYNQLADNSTEEGKATNRRTRIILMPKLSQFYDLLKPVNLD